MSKKFIAYYRVSTTKQGSNGLGMDAQRHAVSTFLNGSDSELVAEFKEVETGKRNQRPELSKAIAWCRKKKATLLIAKLDRLSRNAAFLLTLQESGLDFICCDMPHADKFTIGILALVAQKERETISQRTKDGLAAARRRGTQLGNPRLVRARPAAAAARTKQAQDFACNLKPVLERMQKAGVSTLKEMAECLNVRGFTTPHGKAFTRQAVSNLKRRLS